MASVSLHFDHPPDEDDEEDVAEHPPSRNSDLDTEKALVARLQAGDPAAFAELVASFANRLMRFAFQFVGTRDAAEEVVQHVLVQVWERRAIFTPGRLKPYLFGAVRNRALQERRAEGVRDRYKTTVQQDVVLELPLAASPSPEGRILNAVMVQAAIEQLSERRRLAVRLRLEEDMTNAEIAEVLGLSLVATKQLIARAIADLRELLSGAR